MEIGIGQKTDIDHEIGMIRYAVFESEGHDLNLHVRQIAMANQIANDFFQLMDGHIRGVDNLIRRGAKRGQGFFLPADAVDQVFTPTIRVVAPGLAVALHQLFFRGFQKNDGQVMPLHFQGLENVAIFWEELFFAGIHHKGQAGDIGIVLGTDTDAVERFVAGARGDGFERLQAVLDERGASREGDS